MDGLTAVIVYIPPFDMHTPTTRIAFLHYTTVACSVFRFFKSANIALQKEFWKDVGQTTFTAKVTDNCEKKLHL